MTKRCVLEHRGGTLAYALAGDGPPAIFIQGVSVHGDGWRPQVEALSQRFCCLWFDNRGIGKSSPQPRGLSIESMADDALALIDAQGWESAHVIGHSMGGAIAQALALDRRERVRSLALLCTFARFRDAFTATRRLLPLSLRTRIGTARMRRWAFLEMVMPPQALRGRDRDALARELEPLFGHPLDTMPKAAMQQAAAIARFDSTPRLGELDGVPTLVVSAEHDPIAPPVLGQKLAAGIPGARFEQIRDASHGVTIHRGDAINALLSVHFERAEQAWRDG
jgi:pimeloyl-ACP methyl ester carboxylesterase